MNDDYVRAYPEWLVQVINRMRDPMLLHLFTEACRGEIDALNELSKAYTTREKRPFVNKVCYILRIYGYGKQRKGRTPAVSVKNKEDVAISNAIAAMRSKNKDDAAISSAIAEASSKNKEDVAISNAIAEMKRKQGMTAPIPPKKKEKKANVKKKAR